MHNLRVALLCDSAEVIARHHHHHDDCSLNGYTIDYILINRPNTPLHRFFLETHKALIKLLIRGKLDNKLISRLKVIRHSISNPKSISYIKQKQYDIGLHCYPTIYREEIIKCFRLGILNAHIGLLPQLRGRSVTEWGLILGIRPTVSTFFIDTGIDTGSKLIKKHKVEIAEIGINDLTEFKAYLFHLDAIMYKSAIVSIFAGGSFVNINDGDGLRFYRVSKLLEGVAQSRLLNYFQH